MDRSVLAAAWTKLNMHMVSNLTIFYAGVLICMFVNREIADCVLILLKGNDDVHCDAV